MRKYLSSSEIMYIEGDGNYSTLSLSNGSTMRKSYTLKWFANQYRSFIRISKHVLINPEFVEHWEALPANQLTVTISQGKRMPIAVRRANRVSRQLKKTLPVLPNHYNYLSEGSGNA